MNNQRQLKKFLCLIIIVFFTGAEGFSQEVYPVDPEKINGLVPEYYQTQLDQSHQASLKERVTIYNGYLRDYVLSLSYDRTNWQKVTLRKLNYAMFRLKSVYVRILSADNVKFDSLLDAGNVYSLSYDDLQKKWVLTKVKI